MVDFKKYSAAKKTPSQKVRSGLFPAQLEIIARTPTKNLPEVTENDFWGELKNKDFMRIAVLLAQKSFSEGGCPIGAVIIDNSTRQILGKGHNTLVQNNDPTTHGETAAIRDAGRIDFSRTTIFTSLSPCDVCANLIHLRGFKKVVVGDVTNASGNEDFLRENGVAVEILEDEKGVELYSKYRRENPALDLEDWRGVAAL
jgi:cytosine deaminase